MCINQLCLVKKVDKDAVEIETPSGKIERVCAFLVEDKLEEGDKVIVQAGFVIDKVEGNNSNVK